MTFSSTKISRTTLSDKLSSMESPDPPFEEKYKTLIMNSINEDSMDYTELFHVTECELPLIDLNRLTLGRSEMEDCKNEIAKASQEWGFFQVINHGISHEILEMMRREQVELFKKPFHEKVSDTKLNFPAGSYRWGTPVATSLRHVSWSEAFHVPLNGISSKGTMNTLSSTMEQFAKSVSDLALLLTEILAENLGHKSNFFEQNCLPSTCYLRMNRYPPCPIFPNLSGLMPHTDSSFLTILHQDNVGGLQLVKDGNWIAVKPNQEALIINIGDLFQAWSNDAYKSVEHRVVTNKSVERFSTAYFLCPSYKTVIESVVQPSYYKSFSFGEFIQEVKNDVKKFGHKVGLRNFLILERQNVLAKT